MYKISIAITALVLAAVSLPAGLSAQENTIGTTGNVGIGTGATAPPNRLTIESTNPIVANYIRMEHKGIPNSLLFFGTAPSNYQVTLQQNANVLESYTDLHLSAANTGRIFFETGRTGTAAPVRMTLTNTGLGIGTTTPAQRLEIYTAGPSSIQLTNSSDVLGSVGAVRFNMAGSEVSTIEAERTIATGRQSALKFSVRDDAGLIEAMRIADNGSVGIGTTSPGSYKLAVAGTIAARRVKVTQETWPDYVFNKDYKLPALSEVEKYINANQHLPEIASAAEVKKDGLDLGEMNEKLLRKVEELTLYLINLEKQVDLLKRQIEVPVKIHERKLRR